MQENILIVDDNEEILELVSEILSGHYEVYTALDGQQALNILHEKFISLIISDIMMPGIDGLELCQIIKTSIAYCHIPVVMLTAKNTYVSQIEGLEAGADAYIQKPFLPEFLQIQLSNLLKNRSKIKAHFARSPFANLDMVAQNKNDELFLQKLEDFIRSNIRESHLNMDRLADHMNMSRPTFYRKVKLLSALSPKELVSITKLKRAAELIALGQYSINEITRLVGFNSQNIFSKNFQKYFEMTPYVYSKQLKNEA